ncbi:MAG: type I-C CRISPR-associated protein Cas8c/Csd1, partial [Chloroflexi bacterium]|nr:type I-C CRISPR-associated protein Cas8c/Csd1 [Chloroflexota bacterium]
LSQQPREPESDAVLHVAALSATGGRIIVRDHFSTTVGAATRNVTRFLQNQALPSANGEPEWFTLQEIERSLVHPNRIPGRQMEGRSRVPVPVAPALLRLAFLGEPSKPWLLHLASRRARILSSAPIVSHRQRGALASLIKLTQSSNGRDADGRGLAGLGQLENAVETGSAFLAGRLLALAQALWRIHGPRNGVMGHWFSVAATAPRMALPRLAEQVRQQLSEPATLLYPHMSAYLQNEFDEILRGVDRFPIRLSVAEQGVFALGHYYQHIQAEQAIAQEFGHRQVA